MFHTKQSKKVTKPIFPSDVTPNGKTKKYKETHSQTLMNYEIIRDKVQSQFQPKTPAVEIAATKKPNGQRKLINF